MSRLTRISLFKTRRGLCAAIVLALLGTSVLAACDFAQKGTPSPSALAELTASPLLPSATVRSTPTLDAVTPLPETIPTPVVITDTTARHLRVFSGLWETVRDTYVYPDFNGLDWDDVYRRYRARIETGLDDEGFYQAMREMIDSLGDEHSIYYSPEEAAEEDAQLAGGLDYVGIGIYVTMPLDKDYAVLLQVFPGSPAQQAGLRGHDRILAVDGMPVVDERGEENLDLLGGPIGSEVRLTVQTPGQAPRDLIVTRAHIQTQFPVEARRIPGTDVGYILIPTFSDQTMDARVRQSLEDLMADGKLDGLILDMRINDGGLITVLEDTLSLFTQGAFGAFVSRDAERPLVIEANPVGNSQAVPLVVLVGRETASFGEVFSGVLQETGRSRVIGRTTDGNVEILWQVDFEDGSRVWIASETFHPPSGADWETSGITPDLEIPLDWGEFTPETDQQLQAALDWLLQTSTD
jgi:carboxyl-terminal processing protease